MLHSQSHGVQYYFTEDLRMPTMSFSEWQMIFLTCTEQQLFRLNGNTEWVPLPHHQGSHFQLMALQWRAGPMPSSGSVPVFMYLMQIQLFNSQAVGETTQQFPQVQTLYTNVTSQQSEVHVILLTSPPAENGAHGSTVICRLCDGRQAEDERIKSIAQSTYSSTID